jgi:ABC-type Na+ efflux pump permease subunit
MELYNYSDKENKEFMLSMIGNFLERFKKENNERGSFIVSYVENEKTKYKQIRNIELLNMYKPLEIKRGRELFRSRATTAKNKRSKGVVKYKQTQTRKTKTKSKSPTKTKSKSPTKTKSKSPTKTKSKSPTKTKSKTPTTH